MLCGVSQIQALMDAVLFISTVSLILFKPVLVFSALQDSQNKRKQVKLDPFVRFRKPESSDSVGVGCNSCVAQVKTDSPGGGGTVKAQSVSSRALSLALQQTFAISLSLYPSLSLSVSLLCLSLTLCLFVDCCDARCRPS